jgi:hypothetical protein
MTVTDVTALVKEQIASFDAGVNSVDAALAALTGASGLDISGTDLNISGSALNISGTVLSALLRSSVAGSSAGSVRASAQTYMAGARKPHHDNVLLITPSIHVLLP